MKTLRRGFTLIELLIVVAIIGILAVALVPTISDAPARARDATRKALVNSVITAIESYNIDNGGYPAGANPNELSCLSDAVLPADLQALITTNLNGNPPVTPNPVSNPPAADQDGVAGAIDCTDAVFYVPEDGTSYSVGIMLEIPNGTNSAGVEAADGQFFVIERG